MKGFDRGQQKKEAPLRCLFLLLMVLPAISIGQSLEELQRFDLGTIAIPSNDTVSELDFPRSGQNLVVNGSLVVVEVGVPGRYSLSDFPPNTPVTLSAVDALIQFGGLGGSESLSVSQYDLPSLTTNSLGEAEFQMGALLQTSGSGLAYEDGPYSGSVRIEMTYWEPSTQAYETLGFNAEVDLDVRTSLDLTESEALSFGTIFARAEAMEVASLILDPDGGFSIVNAGDARMVALSNPSPAVIVVAGAASNRQLSITLDSSDIEVRNVDEPGGPYFIFNDLVSVPSDGGTTDEDGVLEIRIGGTLSTQLTSETVVYPAGSYQGTYNLTVAY